ncbi:DUF397 domain-containing protein [Streptomyces fumanus]|uniref:DUF397 domain-containing protein n=1 Tax=Streptomyces fumanus TaxID=67302 RepID=A0A919E4J7_9ACTN|nr:DUF397 domain-containing protein [Streptomyces fumanus]GHF12934.1 hypothetical protein GCM10018772_42600 [Streptomyces fumanus]
MPTNAEWRKSSYSSDQGGECVEVATPPHRAGVAVRDSKVPTGPVLTLTPAAFTAFLAWTTSGRASARTGGA